jgi:hypothetical protein
MALLEAAFVKSELETAATVDTPKSTTVCQVTGWKRINRSALVEQ